MDNSKKTKKENAVKKAVKKIKVKLDYRTIITIKETALSQWLSRYPKAEIIS